MINCSIANFVVSELTNSESFTCKEFGCSAHFVTIHAYRYLFDNAAEVTCESCDRDTVRDSINWAARFAHENADIFCKLWEAANEGDSFNWEAYDEVTEAIADAVADAVPID